MATTSGVQPTGRTQRSRPAHQAQQTQQTQQSSQTQRASRSAKNQSLTQAARPADIAKFNNTLTPTKTPNTSNALTALSTTPTSLQSSPLERIDTNNNPQTLALTNSRRNTLLTPLGSATNTSNTPTTNAPGIQSTNSTTAPTIRSHQIANGYRDTAAAYRGLSTPQIPTTLAGTPSTINNPVESTQATLASERVPYGISAVSGLLSALSPSPLNKLDTVAAIGGVVGNGILLDKNLRASIQQYNPNVNFNNFQSHGQTTQDFIRINAGSSYLTQHLQQQTAALKSMTNALSGNGRLPAANFLLHSLNSGAAIGGSDDLLFGSTSREQSGELTRNPIQNIPAIDGMLPYFAAHVVPGVNIGDLSQSVINSHQSANGSRATLSGLSNSAQKALDDTFQKSAAAGAAELSNIGQGITNVAHDYFTKELPQLRQAFGDYQNTLAEFNQVKQSAYQYYFGTGTLDNSLSETAARDGLRKLALEASRGPNTQNWYGVLEGADFKQRLISADQVNTQAITNASQNNSNLANFYNKDVTHHATQLWAQSDSVRFSGSSPIKPSEVYEAGLPGLIGSEAAGGSNHQYRTYQALQQAVDDNQRFFSLATNPDVLANLNHRPFNELARYIPVDIPTLGVDQRYTADPGARDWDQLLIRGNNGAVGVADFRSQAFNQLFTDTRNALENRWQNAHPFATGLWVVNSLNGQETQYIR